MWGDGSYCCFLTVHFQLNELVISNPHVTAHRLKRETLCLMHASVTFLSVITGQPPSCLVVIQLSIFKILFIMFVCLFLFALLIVQSSYVSRFPAYNQSRTTGSNLLKRGLFSVAYVPLNSSSPCIECCSIFSLFSVLRNQFNIVKCF